MCFFDGRCKGFEESGLITFFGRAETSFDLSVQRRSVVTCNKVGRHTEGFLFIVAKESGSRVHLFVQVGEEHFFFRKPI